MTQKNGMTTDKQISFYNNITPSELFRLIPKGWHYYRNQDKPSIKPQRGEIKLRVMKDAHIRVLFHACFAIEKFSAQKLKKN